MGVYYYSMHGISYQDLTVYDKDSCPYKTNLEKAKELMKEAGLEDGVTLTLITHNASGYYQTIAEILANQLKEINVDVDINVYEPADFLNLFRMPQTEAGIYPSLHLRYDIPQLSVHGLETDIR